MFFMSFYHHETFFQFECHFPFSENIFVDGRKTIHTGSMNSDVVTIKTFTTCLATLDPSLLFFSRRKKKESELKNKPEKLTPSDIFGKCRPCALHRFLKGFNSFFLWS